MSKKIQDSELKPILDRLDAIIRLIAVSLPKEMNQSRKIEILSSVGLGPGDIAQMLGTTPNTVSVTLSGLKKKVPKESQAPQAPKPEPGQQIPSADSTQDQSSP